MVRADGRGHWPLGRRRHADVRPPRGWPDLSSFLVSVRDYCRAHRAVGGRAGAHQALADFLGVHPSQVSAWLSERKWPGQERVDGMGRWLKQRTRKGRKTRQSVEL